MMCIGRKFKRQKREPAPVSIPFLFCSRYATHEKSKKHKENAALLKQLMEEEEGTEQATGAESRDNSCLEQEANATPHHSQPTDEGLSDGSVSGSDEQALDGPAGPRNGDEDLPSLSALHSDSSHGDDTPPISAHPNKGDSL